MKARKLIARFPVAAGWFIPNQDGSSPGWGSPQIRYRLASNGRATRVNRSPIFERPSSAGADVIPRPTAAPLDASCGVQRLLESGHTDVVDIDVSNYLDEIPHDLTRRIAVPSHHRSPRP